MSINVLVIGSYEATLTGVKALLSFEYKVTLAVKNDERDHLKRLAFPTHQLHIIYYDSIRDEGFLNELKKYEFDYISVFTLNSKVPNSIISLAKVAAINFHHSLLPKYRGPDPEYWVLVNKEKETGITAHVMTDKYDEGDIIQQVSFEISEYETYDSLKSKTIQHLPELLASMKPSLDRKELDLTQQEKGFYLKKKSGVAEEVNWSLKASEIEHLIRCNHSNTPLFTILANRIIQILEVTITTIKSEKPGKITIRDEQLHIGTHDFDLELSIIIDNYAVFSGKRFLSYYNFI